MADVSIPRATPATGPADRIKPDAQQPRRRERGKGGTPAPVTPPPDAEDSRPPEGGLDVVV